MLLYEQKLFHTLAINHNNGVSYQTLIENIWNDSQDNRVDSLKTLVKNIRKKFPEEIIINVFGFGYKI